VTSTAAQRLALFAIEWPADGIPAEVRERAKLHLLDALGCGLAAVGAHAGDHATTLALEQGGRPQASIIGAGELVPSALAALANGTRCHALDFDDTHEAGICHASTVVGPAALAAGEASGASGADVLAAYVVGGEVALRIAVAAADGLYERGFHPTSVCGAFGAAAAASRLFGLDASATANALGVVGSFAAGLIEYLSDGSATKPLHAGWAAHAGIQAARLAQAGATGPATVIEGQFGLLASHTRGAASGEIADGLGERWELAELAIKPFPACHFAHASTWAAAELAAEHSLAAADVAEVVVRIPTEGEPLVLTPLSAKVAPKTPYDAKFSLPFTVAHHLVRGRLDLDAFSAESIRDPEVLALAGRVRGEPLAEPAPSRFAGGARLVTRDGVEHDRFLPHAPGSRRNPLDEEFVLSKFQANAELSLAPSHARATASALRALDDVPSLDSAAALLRSAAGRP
jgi:2-methylcitrate dehydratase PrpD